MPFQIFIYGFTLSNNRTSVFPLVLLLCSVTRGVVLKQRNHILHYCITPGIISEKQINIRTITWRYTNALSSWSHKEHSCFDFMGCSLFTIDVFWGTSIFGNSSSSADDTQSRLSSRISFCSLWLCLLLTLPDRISLIKISKTCINEGAQWSVQLYGNFY